MTLKLNRASRTRTGRPTGWSGNKARQSKSTPQADASLLATINAVGLVQPPIIAAETGGGNGYIIDSGHRRVKQANIWYRLADAG